MDEHAGKADGARRYPGRRWDVLVVVMALVLVLAALLVGGRR